jgi:hypothetical protein
MDMTGLLDQTKLFDYYKGCSVKVIIKNKENTMLFDLYMEKLEAVDPMSIQVVTDHLHMDLEDDSDIIDEAEDTLTILDNYVEGLEIKSSKQELQTLLRSLHDEALSVI